MRDQEEEAPKFLPNRLASPRKKTLPTAEILRNQLNNLYNNTPGINTKMDLVKEMYDDYRIGLGLMSPEDSNNLQSQEAKDIRAKIKDYKAVHSDERDVEQYARQINSKVNAARARRHTDARFEY